MTLTPPGVACRRGPGELVTLAVFLPSHATQRRAPGAPDARAAHRQGDRWVTGAEGPTGRTASRCSCLPAWGAQTRPRSGSDRFAGTDQNERTPTRGRTESGRAVLCDRARGRSDDADRRLHPAGRSRAFAWIGVATRRLPRPGVLFRAPVANAAAGVCDRLRDRQKRLQTSISAKTALANHAAGQ